MEPRGKDIARALLPRRNPLKIGPVEFSYHWNPATHDAGGDILWCEPSADATMLSFGIGDVEGKGFDAALGMTAIQGLFHALRRTCIPLSEEMATANLFLCKLAPKGFHLTTSLFICRIHLDTREFEYCNAGHPPPVLFPKGNPTSEAIELSTGGVLLGVVDEQEYKSATLGAQPGDILAAFTDGYSESLNSDGVMYQELRNTPQILGSLAAEKADAILQGLLQDVTNFAGKDFQSDDLTVAVLKF